MPMQHVGTDTGGYSSESYAASMDPGSPEGGSSRARQRLKPWLEAKINSGRFPGLTWVDQKEGIFRIKWKHGGRADWSEEDGLIFKEWAIHTGRYREGTDNPDWPSWKTRLRCALNKLPDIQELKDQSCYDEPNPYRVYKFVDRRVASGSSSPTHQRTSQSVNEDSCSYNSPPPLYEPPLRPSVIQPNIPNIITESLDPEAAAHRQGEACGDTQISSLGSDLEQVSINDLLPIGENISLTNISVDSNINSCPPEPMDTDSLKGPSYQQLSQHVKTEPIEKPDPLYYQACISDHELTLILRYRRQLISRQSITNPHGCRVFYGTLPYQMWDSQLFGDSKAEQVLVPYRPGELEKRQDELTTKLLDALELGINIYVHKGSIYVLRRCKASVFTAPPNQEEKRSFKVERQQEPVKVFDFSSDFLPAFMRYQQGEGPRPSPQVIIAIGQNFNASVEPYTNLLLSVTVVHPQASHLLAQHVPESPPVEISRSNEYDQYLNLIRESTPTLSVAQAMPLYTANSTN